MEVIAGFVILFIIGFWICGIMAIIFDKIHDLLIYTGPLWIFIGNNIFAIGGLVCLGLATYIFIFYKHHPAEKHIKAYKKGLISKEKVIEKVSSTMFDFRKEKVHPSYHSNMVKKRLDALNQRIEAENKLISNLKEYIKIRCRWK